MLSVPCSDPPYLTGAPIPQTLGLLAVGGSQLPLPQRIALGPSLVSSQWSVMTEVSVQKASSLPQGTMNCIQFLLLPSLQLRPHQAELSSLSPILLPSLHFT